MAEAPVSIEARRARFIKETIMHLARAGMLGRRNPKLAPIQTAHLLEPKEAVEYAAELWGAYCQVAR